MYHPQAGFKRHDTSVSEKSMKMDSAPPPAWFLGLH